LLITGKLGADVSIEAGQEAARSAILNCLAILQSQLGSLDAVESVVMVSGYIASAPGFHDQPLVLNGASLLLEEVFGEAGQHARVALGVAELPGGAPVEVQLIVRLRMPGK
jgi:enamine deaminase RidA (YjgF/YER057c/UK114 family)